MTSTLLGLRVALIRAERQWDFWRELSPLYICYHVMKTDIKFTMFGNNVSIRNLEIKWDDLPGYLALLVEFKPQRCDCEYDPMSLSMQDKGNCRPFPIWTETNIQNTPRDHLSHSNIATGSKVSDPAETGTVCNENDDVSHAENQMPRVWTALQSFAIIRSPSSQAQQENSAPLEETPEPFPSLDTDTQVEHEIHVCEDMTTAVSDHTKSDKPVP